MNETYQKPEVEIIDFRANDPVMDMDKNFSEGIEWDE